MYNRLLISAKGEITSYQEEFVHQQTSRKDLIHPVLNPKKMDSFVSLKQFQLKA